MENLPYSSYLVQRLWFGRRLYLLRKGAACDCYETNVQKCKRMQKGPGSNYDLVIRTWPLLPEAPYRKLPCARLNLREELVLAVEEHLWGEPRYGALMFPPDAELP